MTEIIYLIIILLERYWWLVGIIFVVWRVSSGFKKKRKSDSSTGRPVQKSQLQEYLEKMRVELEQASGETYSSKTREKPSFHDDDYEDDEEMSPRYVPHSHEQDMQPSRNVKTLVEEIETASAKAGQSQETEIKPLSAGGMEKKPFPQNLDYLTPLKRAMVLSEILGPPKGLN